jgi:acetyl-CoA acetyltransferase
LSLAGATAIVGIGSTDFSKESGRSELTLAHQAATAAIADAGLQTSEIDGMVSYTADDTPDTALIATLGVPSLSFFSRIHYGGGGTAAVLMQAAMAIHSGAATNVLCYRAFNERSGNRFGQGGMAAGLGAAIERVESGWHIPYGLLTPASRVALLAKRYMWESGATSEDFGQVSVIDRRHAATNPAAWFFDRPITIDDHQKSRWIAEPLHLLDCCQETDGAVAVVVSSLDRARDSRHRPAVVAAAHQGMACGQTSSMASFYRDDPTWFSEVALISSGLWRSSGMCPSDIDVAILYDHFTPYVLMQLEAFGFCERNEARHFLSDGHLDMTGTLPLNPHGGQLGEGYLHGMNGITEAVRQIRGSAVNQVRNADRILVSSGTGIPTSAAILRGDR